MVAVVAVMSAEIGMGVAVIYAPERMTAAAYRIKGAAIVIVKNAAGRMTAVANRIIGAAIVTVKNAAGRMTAVANRIIGAAIVIVTRAVERMNVAVNSRSAVIAGQITQTITAPCLRIGVNTRKNESEAVAVKPAKHRQKPRP